MSVSRVIESLLGYKLELETIHEKERAQYAARMNIRLLKAADLNKILHDRGVEKRVTVQRICTRARNESEVREALARIWDDPNILAE